MMCTTFRYYDQGTWKEQLKQKFRNGRRGTKTPSADGDGKENQPMPDNMATPSKTPVKKRRISSGGIHVYVALF